MMNAKGFMNSASFCGCQASASYFGTRIISALLDTASILVVSICVLDVRLLG